MFRGKSTHTIDDKGRIILPVRFRDMLNKKSSLSIMLTVFDQYLVQYPYLVAYTLDEWAELEKRILNHPDSSSDVGKKVSRSLIGNAEECPLDKQGRILVSPNLRNEARMEKSIVLVGLINRFEIWNEDLFSKTMQEGQDPSHTEARKAFMRDVGA